MKGQINRQEITGYVSPTGWLFVNGTTSRTRRMTFAVAKVVKTDAGYEVAYIEPVQQLSDYTNEQVVRALIG